MSDEDGFPFPLGRVAILGVGLIGGSLGMALKRHRLARHIVGVGRSPDKLEAAIRLGAIDTYALESEAGVAGADLIVLCTTVGHILETLGGVLNQVKPGAIVTDVGSTKSAIVRQAGGFPYFVGSHPMAGSEQTGVEAATPLLFQEATWALTPTPQTQPQAIATVRSVAQAVGAETLTTTPEAHDAMVAITSHLPHVLASALMRQASAARAEHPEVTRMSAGSFADGTRVAASSPEIWRDVCLTNRDAVLAALVAFQGQLKLLTQAVEGQDGSAIEAFFSGGQRAKGDWHD